MREEFAHVISVDRNVKYCVVVVEHIRSTISNVDVPVEDTNFALVVFLLSDSSSYCHVVEEAKASNVSAVCMMARWSNNRETGVYPSIDR